jgi:hypothetical protein
VTDLVYETYGSPDSNDEGYLGTFLTEEDAREAAREASKGSSGYYYIVTVVVEFGHA